MKDEEDEHMAVAAGDIGLSCFGLEENTHKQQQKKKRLEQDISVAMKFQSWIERERGTALNMISLARNNAVVLSCGLKIKVRNNRLIFTADLLTSKVKVEKKKKKKVKRDPKCEDKRPLELFVHFISSPPRSLSLSIFGFISVWKWKWKQAASPW